MMEGSSLQVPSAPPQSLQTQTQHSEANRLKVRSHQDLLPSHTPEFQEVHPTFLTALIRCSLKKTKKNSVPGSSPVSPPCSSLVRFSDAAELIGRMKRREDSDSLCGYVATPTANSWVCLHTIPAAVTPTDEKPIYKRIDCFKSFKNKSPITNTQSSVLVNIIVIRLLVTVKQNLFCELFL